MNTIKYIDTPYRILVGIFGPHGQGDPYKIIAEWQLTTPFGWAEIYGYNEEIDSPEDITEWHVQAETDAAFEWLFERLGIDG